MARFFLYRKGDNDLLEDRWVDRWLQKHPELNKKWSRGLDQCRHDAFDYGKAERWFKLFKNTREQYNVQDKNIYNMDKKRFAISKTDTAKIIIP